MDKKIDKLGEELGGKIDALDERLVSVERRLGSLESRMNVLESRMRVMENHVASLEEEMRESFKAAVAHSISIEEQLEKIKANLKNKANESEVIVIEKRVSKLELQVGECEKMIVADKNL